LDDVGRKAREPALRLPAAPGVYRFSDAAGRVLYLGRAVSLRRRVVSYWGDLGDRRHLAPMVARTAVLAAAVRLGAARVRRRRPPARGGDAAGMGGIRAAQRRIGGPARFPGNFHGQKRPRQAVVTESRVSGTAS
jgi:hypothetical protein